MKLPTKAPNLTSQQRKQLRTDLLSLGFNRVSSTPDNGDGEYGEIWTRTGEGGDHVVLAWGKRG